ncbi:MAG: hypothetical protein GF384_08695 [Elusimicrobia bacterium]|nr:hypothetical protein [Elusimicrobiota bacterium]MBD3412689.1 hypothetical protein [Elusimicrobiota bacterium]
MITHIDQSSLRKGIRTELFPIRAVLKRFSNPQDRILTVHCAGTNGKGSTLAFLEKILLTAGYRTGLYTSPHLENITERIRVNGCSISNTDLSLLLVHIQRICRSLNFKLTYFEYLTVAAFLYFKEQHVDVGLIETGMGGRWDATNVIASPVVSIITSIARDHEQFLGSTLAQIAREKAAIIKKHSNVVCGPMPNGAITAMVHTVCTMQQSRLYMWGRDFSAEQGQTGIRYIRRPDNHIEGQISLKGRHQCINAACAMTAASALNNTGRFTITNTHKQYGIAHTEWPARYEPKTWRINDRLFHITIDGAHNPAAVHALVRLLKETGMKKQGLIFGALKDKNYASMLRMLVPVCNPIICMPIAHERGESAEKLGSLVKKIFPHKQVIIARSWTDCARTMAQYRIAHYIVTGSFYLAGELYAYLKKG